MNNVRLVTAGSEGNFGLIEMDEDHPNNNVDSGRIVLQNAAVDAGIAKPTGVGQNNFYATFLAHN